MRARTKSEMAERDARLSKENDRLSWAVQILARKDEPQATEKTHRLDERLTLRLYHVMASHGGVVITTRRIAGQRDSVDVETLDELEARFRGTYDNESLPLRIAIERLVNARRAIYELVKLPGEVQP